MEYRNDHPLRAYTLQGGVWTAAHRAVFAIKRRECGELAMAPVWCRVRGCAGVAGRGAHAAPLAAGKHSSSTLAAGEGGGMTGALAGMTGRAAGMGLPSHCGPACRPCGIRGCFGLLFTAAARIWTANWAAGVPITSRTMMACAGGPGLTCSCAPSRWPSHLNSRPAASPASVCGP